MLCQKRHAEIGSDALKKIILIFRTKNVLAHPKQFQNEELEALFYEDSCQTLAELAELLGVDHTTFFKRLEALRTIQKQGK